MASVRFRSFLLGLVVFLLLALCRDENTNANFVAARAIFDAVPTAAEASEAEPGGRRMMKGVSGQGIMAREADTSRNQGAPKISGDNEGEGKLDKLKVDQMEGFVALGADYYVPKPHPPKNN
ncbi:uncharacterized protein LOC127792781 [Diospyros lotus]|uniref:uncharacterized protein LOC127792781 n=1 Tax=Diospyros lotus TaxID=55363 RepID=UPI00225AC74A|nr:uncharacterized protein LOC127792781 [Diospyros lotus]